MTPAFTLSPTRRWTPGEAEDLARDLQRAASTLEGDLSVNGYMHEAQRSRVAQLYSLAADAWEKGVGVSIGHSRRDRYSASARECRSRADALLATAL